jgi:ParB-like chromosome segregation protein Spo0J
LLVASKRFGFTNPILANDVGDVIAGHRRLAAARKLGLQEVPVILLRHLSELQCSQLMLADNRIALNSGWDLDILKLELADLSQLGADLKLIGFSKNELAAATQSFSTGNTDEDEVPKLEEKVVSRPGSVLIVASVTTTR